MMIKLKEHTGHAKGSGIIELTEELCLELQNHDKSKVIFNNKIPCYTIKTLAEKKQLDCEAHFFIGVDWLIENKLPICVKPKLNNGTCEINFFKILFEALEEPENIKHLDKLVTVYFDKPQIKITQQQDFLTPFLIIQFLQILNSIVNKGLKKSYYRTTSNLTAKVKGRIVINRTIKENIIKHKITKNICEYIEFGIDSEENRFLKKVYLFCSHIVPHYQQTFQKVGYQKQIQAIIQFIAPAFEKVSNDINLKAIQTFKPNPVYQAYNQAIKIARVLLKKRSYNITERQITEMDTYPFWIDMSKLFELYIYSKLRKAIPDAKIHFQKTIDYYTPDYLVYAIDSDGKSIKLVIDAKYTTKYKDEKTRQSDIRQVCAYARQANVYKALNIEDRTKIIDCLIIYADQEAKEELTLDDILNAKEEPAYINFRKLGIKLPEITY